MIAVGISLGVIGGGGSILTVPILVSLFLVRPTSATGYSLFIVGLTSLFGAISFARRREVDFKTALVFAIPSFVAVFATRRFVLPAIPNTIIAAHSFTVTKDSATLLLFAGLMLAVSTRMIGGSTKPVASSERREIGFLWMPAIGVLVGLLAGLVGVGGGFLVIPALVLIAKLPMRTAVGTSLAVIAIQSLLGFTGEMANGTQIPWHFLFALSLVSSVGVFAGSLFGKDISGDKLKPAFGWLLVVVGALMLFKSATLIF